VFFSVKRIPPEMISVRCPTSEVPLRWVGVALEGLFVATGHGQFSMCQLRDLRFEKRIDLMVGLLCAQTKVG